MIEGFKTASVATQDRPVLAPDKRDEISKIADLVEMEAASVVQAADKFHVPCTIFKYVTDTPDHTDDKYIVKYIKEYRDRFFEYFSTDILPKITDRFK